MTTLKQNFDNQVHGKYTLAQGFTLSANGATFNHGVKTTLCLGDGIKPEVPVQDDKAPIATNQFTGPAAVA